MEQGNTAEVDLQQIRQHFNTASADEEHFPSTIDPRISHVRLVREHLSGDDGLAGKRFADVGCGKARFARVLTEAEPACSILALDLAERMLQRIPERGVRPSIHPLAASMTQLPIATAALDGAYATESLEHAVDIAGAVAELCRVVKPGGRIVIIDKNVQAWGRLETPAWERWFGQRELEQMLARHCRQVTSQPISYWDDVEPDGLFLAWLAVK